MTRRPWLQAVAAFTRPTDERREPTLLELALAVAPAVATARALQESMDRVQAILATTPADVEELRRKLQAPTDDDVQAELVAHATGRSILDNVFPPDQSDLGHADRVMRYGPNMVPDTRWAGET